MDNAIVVDNLKKHFGSLKAVDGISLSVKKGEIFGFLGPNGAGKSTTIRCMMGFNFPDSGSVEILGNDMSKHSVAAKKSIGYLPGNVKLYDNWTGLEHIRFFERVRGNSVNLDELIKRLNFDPKVKFRHLSSGSKQKLGLILALMNQPQVVIMDEPTVGLDPLLQIEIYRMLSELRERGTTIFVSSHNLSEVERLCDRAAIIRHGKLAAVENIKELAGKKIYKIHVSFVQPINLDIFKIAGVEKIEPLPSGTMITYTGDISKIISLLTQHNLLDLEIAHASLEDIFMKFYEDDER